MAGKKKTMNLVKKKGKLAVWAADYELRKAFDKFRKDFAGLVGEVSRVDADMKKGVETAKAAKNSVTKLIKDPLVSVPQDLARKVEALENEVRKVKVKLAERALATSLDDVANGLQSFNKDLSEVNKDLSEVIEIVGAHSDRLDDLEASATTPHAHPPDHPAPDDPRQTTLDDAIARSRTKTTEVPVVDLGGAGNPETGEGATR